jgi:hypothetical protein
MSDAPVNLWDKLPGLTDLFDYTAVMSFMDSFLTSKVMGLWYNNQLAVQSWVYTGALMSLTMSFVSAAYVIV